MTNMRGRLAWCLVLATSIDALQSTANRPPMGSRRILKPRPAVATSHYLDLVPMGAPDAILGLSEAFRNDESPDKVNLVVGAYRDDDGKPWVLPSVREAEQVMLSKSDDKEYLPIAGDAAYVKAALAFAYGEDSALLQDGLIAGVQTLSGTGACKIGGEFLSRFLGQGTPIYCSDPTWGNHIPIFKNCGLDVRRYRYFDAATKGLNFDGMMEDVQKAPAGSVFLLHACAHNPTGVDPSQDQWRALSRALMDKGHHVFFDCAYQGFASGDAPRDAHAAIRMFVEDGHKIMLAQSFAKNFGLYGERVGALSLICGSKDEASRVMSQLKLIIRPMYSSPPKHGSSIVKEVLGSEALSAQYCGECASMAERIERMRNRLRSALEALDGTKSWQFISDQIGMFAYTGMTAEMCDELMDKHHIYLTRDGRISIAGLTEANVERVAAAIHEVTSSA